MSFRQKLRCITFVITPIILFHPLKVTAQEIFIYRPYLEIDPISFKKKVTVHGDYFGYLIFPGNFPGYTDLSGEEDRFNFGFQNILFFGQRTRFIGQLLTHDDGRRRTKFDWHFSLRHTIFDNLVLVLGHDSNHDSDHQSTLNQKNILSIVTTLVWEFHSQSAGFSSSRSPGFFTTPTREAILILPETKCFKNLDSG
jgi:hypothetical protein